MGRWSLTPGSGFTVPVGTGHRDCPPSFTPPNPVACPPSLLSVRSLTCGDLGQRQGATRTLHPDRRVARPLTTQTNRFGPSGQHPSGKCGSTNVSVSLRVESTNEGI